MAEVAGLVLSGIPLLVAGVNMILHGVSSAERYFKYLVPLQSLYEALLGEELIYRNMLQGLLNGWVDEHEMKILLSNPNGDAWKSPKLEEDLKNRLGISYNVYRLRMERMSRIVEEIKKLLKLGPDGRKVQINERNKFRHEYKRLKFSLKKKDYDGLVASMKENNQFLLTLTGQTLDLQCSGGRRKRRLPDFSTIQKCANHVYNTLCASFQCGCRDAHGIGLLLEMRKLSKSSRHERVEPLIFGIIFSYSLREFPTPQQTPWALEAAELRIFEPAEQTPQTTDTTQPSTSRTVRFQEECSVTTSSSAPNQFSGLALITDICAELQRAQKWQQGKYVGLLKDNTTAQKLALFSPSSPIVCQRSQELRSLRNILWEPISAAKQQFSRERRLRLAVTLATSLLQLYCTPWINEKWGNDDIVFLGVDVGNSFDQPFIKRKPSQDASQATIDRSQPSRRASEQGVRNRPLFDLGVLLIELCFGEPFEKLRQPFQSPESGGQAIMSDYLVVERLVDKVYEEGGDRYGHAVRRCIRCEFDSRSNDLSDERFREAVYDKVVALLEEDLYDFHNDP
ncbi:uncharacterized protein BKCO1_1100023 [Diplodia corticola]|uniref:DUF7580 domain-containing protein n=1 Tax=Diplodia corticola TaxID=236234 RepID=A0A1J9S9G4_9PEZI|nr:uncharacterized protein BKCO1_1100023 [Diplodia corticola]OJD36532.1 hypothetical protein BKCO1_1100023 [Diplodia corticola]